MWSIVLADDLWHPGGIGIVGIRLVERYHRPTILIALENGQGKGSARSIADFHLYRAQQVSVFDEKHLRFTTRQGGYFLSGTAFGMVDRRGEFRNSVTVQLRVRDIRPSV